MSFNVEKKETIKDYILEKVGEGRTDIASATAESFNVSQQSVHRYINELLEENRIVKISRSHYELSRKILKWSFSRSAGELTDERTVYRDHLAEEFAALSGNVRRIWDYVLSEMINNVIDHSEAEGMELRLERDAKKTGMYIYDNGVGIFNRIKEYYKLSSYEDALLELFKGKLTTDSKHHSGEGIFFSSRMMDEFVIYSSGVVFSHNKYGISNIDQVADESMKSVGTLIYMSLSDTSRRSAKDIFDEYASVDGGFTKTRILLKNVFDDVPVSRSQAKRLCERLNDFEEVVLDFDEIEWMGQGFADQVFRVYASEYPEIRIIPVNMSEDVTRMYNHVKQ